MPKKADFLFCNFQFFGASQKYFEAIGCEGDSPIKGGTQTCLTDITDITLIGSTKTRQSKIEEMQMLMVGDKDKKASPQLFFPDDRFHDCKKFK